MVELYASEFPHTYRTLSTRGFFLRFIIAIAVVLVAAVYRYGWPALANVFVATFVAAVLDRGVSSFVATSNTSADALFNALVLCALLPPATPWYVIALGVTVVVVVGKWTFGGVGSYWMHPAALAYVVVSLSFVESIESWFLRPYTWPGTDFDWLATEFVNVRLFGGLGAVVDVGWVDLLLGNVAGPAGGVVVIVLLAGLFLLAEDVIPLSFPALFVAGMTAVLLAAGWESLFSSVFSGQVALAAFFLVPEPVSRAKTAIGLFVMPLLAGAFSGLFVIAGVGFGSAVFAFSACNALTPLIDTLVGREYIRGVHA